jgi:hypothetical protein
MKANGVKTVGGASGEYTLQRHTRIASSWLFSFLKVMALCANIPTSERGLSATFKLSLRLATFFFIWSLDVNPAKGMPTNFREGNPIAFCWPSFGLAVFSTFYE